MAQFERMLKALQRGLGPVALGLMPSTSFLLVCEAPGVWIGAAMIATAVLLLALTQVPPLLLIGRGRARRVRPLVMQGTPGRGIPRRVNQSSK